MFSWKHSPALLLLTALYIIPTSKGVTEGRTGRIKNKLLDETQFSNPNSFDYNFEDDVKKPVDTNDIYDELVPYLPTFVLHKNGKDVGRTSVPIITRKMPAWSTPPPKQKYVQPYKPFSPRSLDGFEQRPGLTGLVALRAKPANQKALHIKRHKVDIPITVSTTSEELENLHFSRFSQRLPPQQHHHQQRTKTPLRNASAAPPQPSLARPTTHRAAAAITIRTSTARPRQRNPDNKLSPKSLSTIIRPTISNRNDIINNNNNRGVTLTDQDATVLIRNDNNNNNNRQPRPFPKLIGYPFRLPSAERSSSDAAVIKSQPLERFNSGNSNTKSSTVSRSRTIQPRVPVKPLIIHTGAGPYSGPTFNCKVLTPKNDGRPSANNDKTCVLSAPGISADGKCRCTFDVSDRDSNGCALGFLFTCTSK